MKKSQLPELFTVNIESLSHDGRGIANINGKTTFVSGAITNETVICKLTKKHSRFNEAEVTEVLTAAPERTIPLCEHFSICGGCSMQHIDSDAQIQFKQKTLLEQLKHFGKVEPEIVLPPIKGNPWHYRRKARLGVRYVRKKERVLVGFREKFSNFLADIHSCPVLHQSVGTRIADLSALIASLSQYEHIPQIEVAISDHETALIFRHMTPLPEEDINKLCEFAKANNLHFYLQPNAPEKIHKIWPLNSADKLSYFIQLPNHQLEMQFYPLDFIQVNSEINQLMLKQALHLLDPQSTETVLDLFCGLGNFTLPLALYAKHVTGVEGSNEMVVRAAENARHNNIQNVEFHAANLMQPTPSVAWMQKTYDKILLDPPRTGAKELLPFISNFRAKKIVYVSCNPATLARDAGELVYTYGYKLKQVGVINMFPHTSHIEAIALFEK
jgi:23S rRNA (uracil1939-C5)-methyltransferase